MNKLVFILIGFFASIFFLCCVDEIDLNIDTDKQFVVIDGFISDRLDEYRVRVSTSAVIGLGNDNIFDNISGASVRVIDENGLAVNFQELEMEPGNYTGVMEVDPSLEYEVEVVMPDGEIIRSVPARALNSPDIDSLTFEVVTVEQINSAGNTVESDFIDIFTNTSVTDSEKPFLRWRVSGEYEFKEVFPGALDQLRCYVTNNLDLNNIEIFSTDDLNGNVLTDQFVIRTAVDDRFNTIYCFHVDQFGISEQEYDYWTNVQKLVDLEGSLFDPPPGELKNNLFSETNPDNIVLGYFSVSTVSEKRLFIGPQQIGYTVGTECRSFRFTTPRCSDCTTILGSTREKPPYWPI